MDKSMLIYILIVLVLVVLFIFIYQKQKKSYNEKIKNVRREKLTSLEEVNDSHIKHLNKTLEQIELLTEEKLANQEQKHQENLLEKDKYINNLYKISMSRGEIITYQLLRDIKQKMISENLITESEMIIMNNVFIPYYEKHQNSVQQINHLVILPVGLFIIETKQLKNTLVHGLTEKSLGKHAALYQALFPSEQSKEEKTFMIDAQHNSPHINSEVKIINQSNPVTQINRSTKILLDFLRDKSVYNQVINPIIYYYNGQSEEHNLLNFSELKEVPLLTNSEALSNYFEHQLKTENRKIEIEDMAKVKFVINAFNEQKSFELK